MGLAEKAAYLAGRGRGVVSGVSSAVGKISERASDLKESTMSAYKSGYEKATGKDYDTERARKELLREIKEKQREDERERRERERIKAEEERIRREEATQSHRRRIEEHKRKELNIQRKQIRNVEIARSNQRRLARANRPIAPPRGGSRPAYGGADSLEDRLNRASDILNGRGGNDIYRRMRDMDDLLR
jgi:glucan phosphorylase